MTTPSIALTAEQKNDLKPLDLPLAPQSVETRFNDDDLRLFTQAVEQDREREFQLKVARQGSLANEQGIRQPQVFREDPPWEPPLIRPVQATTSVATATCWQPTLVDDQLTLAPGSINDLVPSNIFDSFSVALTGTNYIVAHCSTDGSQINAISLSVESTAPTPATSTLGSAPLAFDVLITIINDGVTYNMATCGMYYTPREALRVDKASPSVGTLPYDSYYNWTRV